MYGLVAPGYAMAEVVVDALLGGPGTFTGADMSTKLKLLGVDVASFGDAFATTEGALELVFADAVAGALQEARRERRRHPAAGRDPGRRRVGVRRAPTDGLGRGRGRDPAARQPRGADPPARSRRGRDRAAGRGGRLLLQQRQQGPDPGGGRRRRRGGRAVRRRHLRDPVHRRRQHLRVLQADGQEDRRGPLRGAGTGRRPQPVRALPADPAGALRRRQRARLHPLRPDRRGARTGPRVRRLQAGGRLDPGQPARRARARPGPPHPAGHQRRLPGQHPAQRHLLRRAADPRRRDHPGAADRDRRGGPRLRALHQDHRWPADRPVRRPDGAAARDLAPAGRRRLRVRTRLRQVAAHGEVVRRLDLVPLRRPGLGGPRDRPGAALPRPALAAQAQGRRQRVRPRVRRGARRRTSA